jgi:membrane protein involved in colicin uptake
MQVPEPQPKKRGRPGKSSNEKMQEADSKQKSAVIVAAARKAALDKKVADEALRLAQMRVAEELAQAEAAELKQKKEEAKLKAAETRALKKKAKEEAAAAQKLKDEADQKLKDKADQKLKDEADQKLKDEAAEKKRLRDLQVSWHVFFEEV